MTFIFLAVFILLLTPLVLLVLSLFRLRIGVAWLVALLGSLSATILVLAAHRALPQTYPLFASADFPEFTHGFTLDEISWPYALAVVTLVLAVLLTVVVRQRAFSWRAWAGSLAMAGFGLLAITAGKPLTILMAWSALDLIELWILLAVVQENEIQRRGVFTFSAKLAGSALLMVVALPSAANEGDFSLALLPPAATTLLVVIVAMRLGILPLFSPLPEEPTMRRGLGSSLRLIPAAASLVVASRAAHVGVPETWQGIPIQALLLVMAGLAALYGAARWALAEDELAGRSDWILVTASLSLVAGIRGQIEASLGWGLACTALGGVIFLFSLRNRYLLMFPLLMLGMLTVVPFAPTMDIAAGLVRPPWPLLPLLWLTQGLLVFGYAQFCLRPADHPYPLHRGLLVVYTLGLATLAAFYGGFGYSRGFAISPSSWGAAIPLGVAAALGIWRRWGPPLPFRLSTRGKRLLSTTWLSQVLWLPFRGAERLIGAVSHLLESEGGLLWTVILVIVLISWLVTRQGVAP